MSREYEEREIFIPKYLLSQGIYSSDKPLPETGMPGIWHYFMKYPKDLGNAILLMGEYSFLNEPIDNLIRVATSSDYKLKALYLAINCWIREIPVIPSWRVKSKNSIFTKLVPQGLLKTEDINLENVYDLIGIRLVTKTPDQCYKVLDVVNSIYPISFWNDNIAVPRGTGYQNISAFSQKFRGMEIQIMSKNMFKNELNTTFVYHHTGVD